MGADTFIVRSSGKDVNEAFRSAVEDACHEHGHGGYTGTIAEKGSFTMIPLPEGANARDYAQDLIDDGDERIEDKWGPAGCISLGNNSYLFFGRASC